MSIAHRLQALGITLPPPKPPVANYLGSKRYGDLLFVAGRVSELKGAVGVDVSAEEAKEAARNTVILLLSIVQGDIQDLDLIAGVLKLHGFIRSSPDFMEQHKVLDGASDVLVEIFGDRGRHARTATGVVQLPFGASVQLDMVLQIKAHRGDDVLNL